MWTLKRAMEDVRARGEDAAQPLGESRTARSTIIAGVLALTLIFWRSERYGTYGDEL